MWAGCGASGKALLPNEDDHFAPICPKFYCQIHYLGLERYSVI